MNFNEFNFFDISAQELNLFSFMLGMTFAFFNQGLFGKNIGKYVISYFILLALWYGLRYHRVI
jgi:hypothetical protein